MSFTVRQHMLVTLSDQVYAGTQRVYMPVREQVWWDYFRRVPTEELDVAFRNAIMLEIYS